LSSSIESWSFAVALAATDFLSTWLGIERKKQELKMEKNRKKVSEYESKIRLVFKRTTVGMHVISLGRLAYKNSDSKRIERGLKFELENCLKSGKG
jgi:hypothetical protein